jgi:hypothetical protein
LAQDSLYQSVLGNGVYDFDIFEVDIPEGQQLEIYMAQCLGETDFRVVKDVRSLNDTVQIHKESRYGYVYGYSSDLNGTAYIIVEDTSSNHKVKDDRKDDELSYLIKVDYSSQEHIDNRVYYEAGNEGQIDFTLKKHKGARANLAWESIVSYDTYESTESDNVTGA